jgi:GNAT superfamily N-acetyltransferase
MDVKVLSDVDGLAALVQEATSDGYEFLIRLVQDWNDGTNRFSRPGECLQSAWMEGTLVGVGGLNVDPYAADPTVSRVRHLYVARSYRRLGVGSRLLARIVGDARDVFRMLRVRTYNSDASAFYVARGFSEVSDDDFCTHRLKMDA